MPDPDDDQVVRAVRAARTILEGLRAAGPGSRVEMLAALRDVRDWLSARIEEVERGGADGSGVEVGGTHVAERPEPTSSPADGEAAAARGGGTGGTESPTDAAASAEVAARAEEAASSAEAAASYVEKQLTLGGARLTVPARLVDRPAPEPVKATNGPVHVPAYETATARPREEEPYPAAQIDLELLGRRIALKQRACAWALARRREEADTWSDAAREEREELVGSARSLPNAYLWPLHPNHEAVGADVLELAEHAYENLGLAVRVAARWSESPVARESHPPEELLYLVAEAQSALRIVLIDADVSKDADQIETFIWVKEAAWEAGTYVRRYMRREDPADPAQWSGLGRRLAELEETLGAEEREERARRKLVGSVEHRARELESVPAADRERVWQAIFKLLERWIDEGRPPSSKEVCLPLLPHVDSMPDELEPTEGAQRVLRAIDEMVAARQAAEEASAEREAESEPSPEVARAAELLRGKVVLLIGGERRPHEQRRLERDLELAELRWLSTRPHRSLDPLLTQIERPEVDLVIVAVRWSDHAFADLRKPTEHAGKPFVHLPGGYGSNQVAHQVLQQVSRQL